MTQPIIIISAPHSGASLVSQMLHSAGIFMGADQEENSSQLFTSINCWLFHQAGATWDNPYNFNFLTPNFEHETHRVLKRQLKGRSFKRYLGQLHRKERSYKKIGFDWGWYAPLSAFTYQIWKSFFEGATIVHVVRNPVDVAAGMKKQASGPDTNKGLFGGMKRRRHENRLDPGLLYGNSQRVQNLYEGFKLWQQYLNRIDEIQEKHTGRFYELRYEDLLKYPGETMKKIFDFLRFRLPDGIIDNAVVRIDSSRAWVFKTDKSLMEFYHTIKNHSMVVERGYHEIGK